MNLNLNLNLDMPPTVLVVQNDAYISAVLWTLLSQRGYRVVCENSGPEGLLLVRSLFPDAVVLDVNLPGVNGLEICRQIKADPDTRSMPVLFCSAQTYLADEAMEFGATAFLSVPGEVIKLPECLRAVLGARV
ncbi:MAG TPA: response regulator [Verrucomicrobiae bacterium]|nr:response regulator [Verrucomicrobiae bacterium]